MATIDESLESHLDEEHKAEKIIYKRRSSIFQTRRTVVCDERENKTEAVTNENKLVLNEDKKECSTYTDAEIFNLKEYIEKLKQERKEWQQEYKFRKIQRKTLTKQKINLERQGQPLDTNALTESQRAFIAARPNYENICRNTQKLHDTVLKITTLNQLVCKLNQRFMEKMEDNIARTTKKVIELSETKI